MREYPTQQTVFHFFSARALECSICQKILAETSLRHDNTPPIKKAEPFAYGHVYRCYTCESENILYLRLLRKCTVEFQLSGIL